jgi:peptidyl-dipeptidase Dcp
MTDNPFFEAWDAIRVAAVRPDSPEHFPPAFDRAIAEHNAEIAVITGSAEAPTFANTIEALERSGRQRYDRSSRRSDGSSRRTGRV